MVIILLTLLAITAVALAVMRNLFAAVMLTGIYSLLTAAIFMLMDAVDVAFTEAAVGAGLLTVLLLGALGLTGVKERKEQPSPWLPFVVVTITGLALISATLDMPHYGDPQAPIQRHVAPEYIKGTVKATAYGTGSESSSHPVEKKKKGYGHEVGPPNLVTSVLGSYRAFDTLGEVVVVLTAATAVLLILGRSNDEDEDEEAAS